MEQDKFYGAFNVAFEREGEPGYVSIHPEMYPKKVGVTPSGRYFIYYMFPSQGTCHFTIEQDDSCNWFSEFHPPFIDKEFINWLGDQIDHHI